MADEIRVEGRNVMFDGLNGSVPSLELLGQSFDDHFKLRLYFGRWR